MILKIRHKGLRQLYEKDMAKGVMPNHVKRLKAILVRMEISTCPDDMDLPGLRLHKLSGDLAAFYSVEVSAN